MPLTIGSSGKVSEGTYSKPSDYASSQRSKEREREDRYEQQRSNFFSGIFGGGRGGQGSQPGGPDVGPPRGMTRPKMRPSIYDPQTETYTPDLRRPTIKAHTKDYFKDLDYSDVPYYQSDKRMRPPQDNQPYKDRLRNFGSSMATDLKLGLGSLSGPEGFTKALEGLGYGTFRNDDGTPSAEALQAYTNFRTRSSKTAEDAEAASMGDGDDNFYGNYDPCPEGYRTDPVTGMCVPVMGVAYDTAPSAPAQYQGNFVGDPFPDTSPRGPALPMGMPMAGYTQPMDFTSPTITPPTPQGIAGIPLTPIMV